jgi:hypothetical protein
VNLLGAILRQDIEAIELEYISDSGKSHDVKPSEDGENSEDQQSFSIDEIFSGAEVINTGLPHFDCSSSDRKVS